LKSCCFLLAVSVYLGMQLVERWIHRTNTGRPRGPWNLNPRVPGRWNVFRTILVVVVCNRSPSLLMAASFQATDGRPSRVYDPGSLNAFFLGAERHRTGPLICCG